MTRTFCTWASFALLLSATVAHAGSVRFVSAHDDPLNRRVIAEIESVGLDVVRSDSTQATDDANLVAIVRVLDDPERVEVWVLEAGRVTLAAIVSRDPLDAEEAHSVRVAERVRAVLQPVAQRLAPAKPEPVAPSPPREPPSAKPPPKRKNLKPKGRPLARDPLPSGAIGAERRRSELDLMGAVLMQPGGVAASAMVRVRYEIVGPLAAESMVMLPILPSTIEEDDASAEVSARLAGAGVCVPLLDATSTLQLRPGLGVAAVWLGAVGQADPPLRGRRTSAVLALPYGTTDVVVRLTDDVPVVVGILIGAAAPRADIEFSGRTMGTWGRPALMGYLGTTLIL